MHIKYSEQAVIDIESIINYIAQDNINRALSYINYLKNRIELLTSSPYMGIECKYKKIYKDCRIYIIDFYLIFYSIKNNHIVIRRILHGTTNYTNKKI